MVDYSNASDAKVEVPEGAVLVTFPARGHKPLIEIRERLSLYVEKQKKLAGIYHRGDS
jgi:hypothetical protein